MLNTYNYCTNYVSAEFVDNIQATYTFLARHQSDQLTL